MVCFCYTKEVIISNNIREVNDALIVIFSVMLLLSVYQKKSCMSHYIEQGGICLSFSQLTMIYRKKYLSNLSPNGISHLKLE
jgi:hypothetical protein